MPYMPTRRGIVYDARPFKNFKVGPVDGGPKGLMELEPALVSVRFVHPGIPDSLFPFFGRHTYEGGKSKRSGDSLAAFLRHHSQVRYDMEWSELRKLRNNTPDPVWRAAAFALCLQCAAEELFVTESLGDSRMEAAVKVWLEKKLREHIGQDYDIAESFYITLKHMTQIGGIWYENTGDGIRFCAFPEYESEIWQHVDGERIMCVKKSAIGVRSNVGDGHSAVNG